MSESVSSSLSSLASKASSNSVPSNPAIIFSQGEAVYYKVRFFEADINDMFMGSLLDKANNGWQCPENNNALSCRLQFVPWPDGVMRNPLGEYLLEENTRYTDAQEDGMKLRKRAASVYSMIGYCLSIERVHMAFAGQSLRARQAA